MTPLTKPVTRLSTDTLDGTFGPDRDRRMVITLVPGGASHDMISIKPAGRRSGAAKLVALMDVYSYAIRCEVNRTKMERLRLAKEKKQQAAERRRSMRIIRGGLREEVA